MKNLAIILTSIVIAWSILVHAHHAHAQDSGRPAVTVIKGHTDVCVVIDENTVQCTRFKKGEKTRVFTVKVSTVRF